MTSHESSVSFVGGVLDGQTREIGYVANEINVPTQSGYDVYRRQGRALVEYERSVAHTPRSAAQETFGWLDAKDIAIKRYEEALDLIVDELVVGDVETAKLIATNALSGDRS